MANVDYGQVRNEKIWVTRETTFNTATQPAATDAIICRGRATLPSVLTDRVPSEEVRPQAPDIDQLIDRKKPPGEFELPCYAKAPQAAARKPQWHVLLENVMGAAEQALTILNYSALVGESVSVKVGAAAPVVLSEGPGAGQWRAQTSNAVTAANLAAAINPVAGVTAFAAGSVVVVKRDPGAGDVVLTTTAPAGEAGIADVSYQLATDITEQSLTITYLADNVLHQYRGCHVSSVAFEVSGSDEGTIRFRGFLGNEVLAGYHTLAAAVAGGGAAGDPVTLTLTEPLCLLIGPRADDTVNLQIDSEIFRVVGPINYSAKTVPCLRGQAGSTPAAHTINTEVGPAIPGPDPDPNDTIIPMTLGQFALEGQVFRVLEATVTNDEHLEARIDEWAEPALTGYRRPLTGRSVDVDFTAYQRRTILALLALAERGVRQELVITIGQPTLVPQIVLTLPRFQIVVPETGESGGEFTQHFTGQGLASSTPGNDGLVVTVRAA